MRKTVANLALSFPTHAHQAVLLPGLGEFGPLLLSGHQNLHVLKRRVVPRLGLEGHLVLWHRLSWRHKKTRNDPGFRNKPPSPASFGASPPHQTSSFPSELILRVVTKTTSIFDELLVAVLRGCFLICILIFLVMGMSSFSRSLWKRVLFVVLALVVSFCTYFCPHLYLGNGTRLPFWRVQITLGLVRDPHLGPSSRLLGGGEICPVS